MLPAATIVFREILEITLILGIILAATRGMPRRGLITLAGLSIGAFGAFIIAFFTESISEMIDGMGQEIFNAAIMFTAVGFLAWTVIWMKKNGRAFSTHLKEVGQDVATGRKPFYVLIFVIALATFREGAEIVLFAYGMTVSGQITFTSIAIGALIGAAGGALVGGMLYFGLLKAAQKHLFTVTAWMLIVLIAGMAAHGAAFLIAAGILPELSPQLWDTSSFIAGNSFLGETLGVLIGYSPRPTGMEALFYIVSLSLIATLFQTFGNRPKPIKTIAGVAAE